MAFAEPRERKAIFTENDRNVPLRTFSTFSMEINSTHLSQKNNTIYLRKFCVTPAPLPPLPIPTDLNRFPQILPIFLDQAELSYIARFS